MAPSVQQKGEAGLRPWEKWILNPIVSEVDDPAKFFVTVYGPINYEALEILEGVKIPISIQRIIQMTGLQGNEFLALKKPSDVPEMDNIASPFLVELPISA